MANATVVLVHGAFHGAWYWGTVARGLGERGITALAPDLPGHGEDPRPLGDLHSDAAAVRAVLDPIEGPVVLVGHSYGGIVITEAGEHPAVTHLVYLAAYAADETESTGNAGAREAEAEGLDLSGRPSVGGALTVADGLARIDPSAAADLLYTGVDPDLTALGVSRLEPQRTRSLRQSPAAVAWRSRPSTFAVCTEDRTIPPELQVIMARRTGRTVTWPTGHLPMLTHPVLVVDLLAGIATGHVS